MAKESDKKQKDKNPSKIKATRLPDKKVKATGLPQAQKQQAQPAPKGQISANNTVQQKNDAVSAPKGQISATGLPGRGLAQGPAVMPISVPQELSQVSTFTNDPAILAGNEQYSAYRNYFPAGQPRIMTSPNVTNPNVVNPQNPILNPPTPAAPATPGMPQGQGLAAPQGQPQMQDQRQLGPQNPNPQPQQPQVQQPQGIQPYGVQQPQAQVIDSKSTQPTAQPKPTEQAQQQGPISATSLPGGAPQAQPVAQTQPTAPVTPPVPTVGMQPPSNNPNIMQPPANPGGIRPYGVPLQTVQSPEQKGLAAQPQGIAGIPPNKADDLIVPPPTGGISATKLPNAYAQGGFTGQGGKLEPAGIVHKGEFVFNKEAVNRLGVDRLEELQAIANNSYADGGVVNKPDDQQQQSGPISANDRTPLPNPRFTGLHNGIQYSEGKPVGLGLGGQGGQNPTGTPNPNPTPSPNPNGNPAPIPGADSGVQVVAGQAQNGQVNIADYAGQLATNPSLGVTDEMQMQGNPNVGNINENAQGTNINPNDPRYQVNEGGLEQTAQTVGDVAQAADPGSGTAQGYEAQETLGDVQEHGQMEAQQGELSEGAIISDDEVPQHDVGAHARGETELGQALNDFASLDLDDVDPRATTRGQLELLQSEFTDPNTGEPRIPGWAAATARGVSRIAAFKGMTGTAATAAMSQAMMEASLPIAQQDAQFFQTVTLQNLSNEQASTINKANVLAKMELTNVDNRLAAAIQNAQNFMQMDLANLDNRQQAEVINQQARVQAIFEDARSVNTARMFTAQSQNEMDMFYDQLGSQVSQFNASQTNNMRQFNTNEVNSMSRFNADMENNREQFEKTMSYNIDLSNARWRQSVTLAESDQKFQAAATDVRNLVDISSEQLNRLWNRSDSMLQYIHEASENEANRRANMAIAQFQASSASKAADKAGWGSLFGSIAGSIAGSDQFLDWIF